MTTAFTRTSNPSPVPDERRAEILAAPGFGRYFTDHMVVIDFENGAWRDPRLVPYGPFTLDPATMVLHYAQEIFEGLKAYSQPDGSVATFRPQANAARLNRSADRLGMPRLPEEMFLQSLRELALADRAWVPTGGEASLYFRPFMFASEVGLGVRPANKYVYSVIASPAGAYFAGGIQPVSVWWSTEYVRAAPGGTGAAKTGGNYAASLAAQAQAAEQGCDQVVWLDAVERRWVEEMGGMNLFFVFGEGADAELVTPELSGSLLPGVTRDSLLQLARDRGYRTAERRISTDEWAKRNESGELTEVFACGTAAVITPVGSVKHADGGFDIAGGRPGAITMELREALTGLQRGQLADPHGWMVPLA
ncbi:branched-chain amino acid aminotransferase [Nakamurella panacisegetis]|uniref:Branched-chain-amino-acid aminotransferase n=1 Tax=Nakamurella panacisegetis TaxID=1090615 RepID=A0A1H0T2S2_9ACTN|nr:branched-chain amino acid aminotransferase [Nakamurella panacisegetis]SDP48343.1 branched-chain amino acid aminotransferase [Nakamurella panacisegetis]